MNVMLQIKKAVCLAAAGIILLGVTGCQKTDTPGKTSNSGKYQPVKLSKNTVDLMEKVSASSSISKSPDRAFIDNAADFAIKLFKQSADKNENSMVSPLSVMIALSMTANGADNNTLAQMEKLLGGSLGIDDLNQYLSAYISRLHNSKKAKMSIANSIWFHNQKKRLTVKDEFLKTNASFYNANIYSSPFDNSTLKDINTWVSKKTDGLIKDILKEIPEDVVMYLINALVFDAEWQKIYNKNRVYEDTFHSNDGDQTVTMMRSKEIKYLKDKKATGFIKPYADGYSFVALMPNEGVAIEDYIKSLKGSSFIKTVSNPKEGVVNAAMPKFSSEYRLEMIEVLKALGMTDAFDGDTADFSRLGHSPEGNLYVSNVIHKTYIKVDERGTKAGAATVVEVTPSSAKAEERYYTVTLDRPFVYAVIDNETNLPLFIGTVLKVES